MVREDLPRFGVPMLARAGTPTDAAGWAYEVKFDGMRAQLRLDRGKLCLRSRLGRDCIDAFPELAPVSTGLRRRRLLLDGELVCLSAEGDPDFARPRARLRSAGSEARIAAPRSPATFIAFDLLHLDGSSTRELPYAERRALLAELALDGPTRSSTPATSWRRSSAAGSRRRSIDPGGSGRPGWRCRRPRRPRRTAMPRTH